MAMQIVHVAVGVVQNTHGHILISHRAAHQHQGNRWEFPGGKVETGESVQEALQREFLEELNIRVVPEKQLITLRHAYPEKTVLLDVWLINEFSGSVEGQEGQAWRWVPKEDLASYQFPDANAPIIKAIEALKDTPPA